MPNTESPIDYSIIKPRMPRLTTRLAAVFIPGVRTSLKQIKSYARAWEKVNGESLQKNGPLWVVLGDSTAQGVGAISYDQGYVGQLDQILKNSGKKFRIINLSFSGARADDVLKKQIPIMNKLGTRPDLVSVFVGYNNLGRKKLRETLGGDLKEIIAQLPKGSVIGLIPARPGLIKPYNDLILQQAKEHDLIVADIPKALGPPDRSKYAADHYHPNEKGYADYARAFALALGIKS